VFEQHYLPMGVGNDNTITQDMVESFVVGCEVSDSLPKTTIVKATLVNGFEVVASSSCVDPKSYDSAMGEGICINRIGDKVWELLGFLLQMAENGITFEMAKPEEKPIVDVSV